MSGHLRGVIAVVDDDLRMLESLEALLESAGYDVQLHSSGSSLLSSSVSNVDCLITDIVMPVMNGFELRDRVKRLRPELPVFLMSGRRELLPDRQDDGQVKTMFLGKPFDGPSLLASIAQVLKSASG